MTAIEKPAQCQAYIETPTNARPLFEPAYKRWHCRRPFGHPLTRSEPDLATGYYKTSAVHGVHISDPLEGNDNTALMTWVDEADRCGYEY